MQKLNLTYVQRTPRTSGAGKPFISVSIKATQYGEKYLSGFGNKANEDWKPGDEVEVESVKEVPKGDKVYLNFEMSKAGAPNAKQHEEVMNEFTKVKMLLNELVMEKRKNDKTMIAGTDIPYPQPEDEGIEELDDSQIPF